MSPNVRAVPDTDVRTSDHHCSTDCFPETDVSLKKKRPSKLRLHTFQPQRSSKFFPNDKEIENFQKTHILIKNNWSTNRKIASNSNHLEK